jgi:hypothetical protein
MKGRRPGEEMIIIMLMTMQQTKASNAAVNEKGSERRSDGPISPVPLTNSVNSLCSWTPWTTIRLYRATRNDGGNLPWMEQVGKMQGALPDWMSSEEHYGSSNDCIEKTRNARGSFPPTNHEVDHLGEIQMTMY